MLQSVWTNCCVLTGAYSIPILLLIYSSCTIYKLCKYQINRLCVGETQKICQVNRIDSETKRFRCYYIDLNFVMVMVLLFSQPCLFYSLSEEKKIVYLNWITRNTVFLILNQLKGRFLWKLKVEIVSIYNFFY